MRIVACIAALQLAASIALSNAGSFADSLDQRPPQSERDANMVGRWERALAQDPARLSSYHGLALALRRLGRDDDAIAVLQRALWLNPIDASTNRELGMCFYSKEKYAQSIPWLRRSVWYAPTDFQSWRWLGYNLYEQKKYDEASSVFETALLKNPKSFDAEYWRGMSLTSLQRYDEAAKSLTHAVELEPADFDANYWCGFALLRTGNFRDATVRLEKAHALKPSSSATKTSLMAAYAGAGEYTKAFRIYPLALGIIGAVFVAIYLVGLAGLCWFSFRIGRAAFPPLTLSLLWLAFMFEGQVAFIFVLGLLPLSAGAGSSLLAVMLPALPVLIASIFGFKRQPWGAPFQWPLRFGGPKTIGLALLLLLVSFILNVAAEKILMGSHHPVQKAVVFLRESMNLNPVLGLLTIGLVVPAAEEILFRGMIFSSLQKWWRTGWVIFATALLFALVHLDLVFFFPLFFLGLVLGWARCRSRSLGLSIFIHAVNNCVAVLAMMFMSAS